MQNVQYPQQTRVFFHSAFEECPRDGHVAIVLFHGNGRDESGVAHVIKFEEDGHMLGAYPRELTPVTVH